MGHVKSLDPKSEKQRHVLLPSRGKIGVTSCDRPSRHVGADCSDCWDDHRRDGSDRHGRHHRHPATPAITLCSSLWRSASILPLRSSTDWTFWRTTPGVTASMIKHSTKRRTVFSLGTLLLSHSITPSFDHTTRGPSDFDRRHRFVATYVWGLPGLRTSGGLGSSLLGGWELTGILSIQTGAPFTVLAGADSMRTGLSSQRAVILEAVDPYQSGPGKCQGFSFCEPFLSPAAFALPASNTFSAQGKNVFRGPNQ